MNGLELIAFLNRLKTFVPRYWRGRIEEVILKLGGQITPSAFSSYDIKYEDDVPEIRP